MWSPQVQKIYACNDTTNINQQGFIQDSRFYWIDERKMIFKICHAWLIFWRKNQCITWHSWYIDVIHKEWEFHFFIWLIYVYEFISVIFLWNLFLRFNYFFKSVTYYDISILKFISFYYNNFIIISFYYNNLLMQWNLSFIIFYSE